MTVLRARRALLLATAAISSAVISPAAIDRSAPAVDHARMTKAYGQLPISFEANQGQSNDAVKFLSRGRGYGLFLTSTEAVLTTRSSVLRLQLRDASEEPRVTGEDELPGKNNYFIGNDPAAWRTNVPTYAKVRYHDVYPGIDLIYYGAGRELEYDFIVAPGADPSAIRLAFEGARGAAVDNADLVLDTTGEGEDVRVRKPVAYQMVDGRRKEVAAEYVVSDADDVRFKLGRYDAEEPLVIDPVLVYSTYLGTNRDEEAHAIAVDGAGNAYVTGHTNSTTFPTASPLQPAHAGGYYDVFIAKLNAAGSTFLYSTYLGGGGDDYGFAIAVDAGGNAYITGRTGSTNFPTANPLQPASGGGSDAFVAKLNATGSALLYSTFLGGTGRDEAFGIAVDAPGNAYLTGATTSANFPTANPFQAASGGGVCNPSCDDAFVTKMNPGGSALVYSTYLGGGYPDEGRAITIDASGNAYVTGETRSLNFPTVNPFQRAKGGPACSSFNALCANAFVTKLNTAGSALIYSTYLGGNWNEIGYGIAVDGSGQAYVTGYTRSSDFPTANAWKATLSGNIDAFITKLNPTGSALVYSTYFGGNDLDWSDGIAIDGSGYVYISGVTRSSDFPLVPICGGPEIDAFAARLNAAGTVLSTYCLGGSRNEWRAALAIDASGNAYLSGYTDSPDFPTTASGPQPTYGGGSPDAFVTKIDLSTTAALGAPTNFAASAAGSTVTLTWSAPLTGTPTAYIIEGGSANGLSDLANFSTGSTATTFSASGVPNGTYFTRVRAANSAGSGPPSNEAVVTLSSSCTPGAPSGLTVISNSGGRVALQWAASAGSPASYVIEAGSGPGLANIANIDLGLTTTLTATAPPGVYFVRVRARNGCGTSGPSNEVQFTVS